MENSDQTKTNISPPEEEYKGDNDFLSVEYTLNDAGEYVKVISKGYEPENIVLKQVWDSINEQIEITRKKVIAGELSPLAYYMEKNQMDIKRIAFMTGIPKRKVKKHLKPEVFGALQFEILSLYAGVFNISLDQIRQIK